VKLHLFVVSGSFFFLFFSCPTGAVPDKVELVIELPVDTLSVDSGPAIPAAWRTELYLPLIEGKRVGMVLNQSSLVGETHLLDTLLQLGVQVTRVFSPEHGFRGTVDAGTSIKDTIDHRTGLPITSLYGREKKPKVQHLQGLDLLIFDIQDVGARFYTYISSLHYIMEACAEVGLPLMVLDRPNPNGHYVDGPVLDMEYRSFVGMHPVPVVHGMTIAEYAQMIQGEGWLPEGAGQCKLILIPCARYNRCEPYELPVRPSPNLPNMRSVYLYPSLCFFEGTMFSVGRGTDKPFQQIGIPDYPIKEHRFMPMSTEGANHPDYEGEWCYGEDFSHLEPDSIYAQARLDLSHLIRMYQRYPQKDHFFRPNKFIVQLAGSRALMEQMKAGMTEEAIRATWQEGLDAFRLVREKYLIYPDCIQKE
jgi:uncharacterized protein YbbC (DUF1343 family)